MAKQPQVPRAPGTDADGNTHGKAVGLSAPADVPAAGANSPVSPKTAAEADTGAKVLDGIQIGLDVVGLIPGVGEFADLANVGISAARGDWLGASLSLASAIPFAGWFATGAKAAKRVAAEAAAKTAKNAAEEAAEQAAKHSDEAAAAARKGKDGGKVKSKKKLKCGDQGSYRDLKKKSGDGKFDRDHIPSKAALKKRAEGLWGQELSPQQARAIDNAADTIAIPRQAHIDVSPTYGQSSAAAMKDAGDLAGAARRDVEAMLNEIEQYDADGGCKRAYQKAADKILHKSNADFDKFLSDILQNVK